MDVNLQLVPTLSVLYFWKPPFTCHISLKVPLFLLIICWWVIWVSAHGRHCLTFNVSSNLRTRNSPLLLGSGAQLLSVFPAWKGAPLKGRRELALQTRSLVCWFLKENKQPVTSVVGMGWLLIRFFLFPTLESIMCILVSRATVDAAPQYHRFKKEGKRIN